MKQKEKVNIICTEADYKSGRHHNWEVQAHVAASEFLKKHGVSWTHAHRRQWIEHYMQTTPYVVQMKVIECPVCVAVIHQCIATGTSPFEPPSALKAELKKLAARLSPQARNRLSQSKLDWHSEAAAKTPPPFISPTPDVMSRL